MREEDLAQAQGRSLVLGGGPVGRIEQLLEVGAGAEILARPAERHHPHLGVEVGPFQRRKQGVDQRGRSARSACRADRG